MRTLKSHSADQTLRIGESIGRKLKKGDVVALFGDLGAGKTTLTKGICKGLGVPNAETEVSSPTFALVHEYCGREKIFHLDWYRLKAVKGVDWEMAEQCFEPEAVTIVEWAERGRDLLPERRIEIKMKSGRVDERTLRILG